MNFTGGVRAVDNAIDDRVDISLNLVGTANQVTVTTNLDGSVTLSLPQDIATTSTPTFGGATLSGTLQPSANNTVDIGTSAAQFRTAYIGTSVVLGAAGSNRTTLAFTAPTASNTITLPDASGTVAVSVASPLSLSAAGQVSLGTVPVANGGTGATTLAANGILVGNGTSAVGTITPGASGTVLRSNGTNASFAQLAAADINNTGTGSFLVNVPGTTAANTVAPTADVSGLTVRQTTAGSPTADVFNVGNSAGTQSFLRVNNTGSTVVGNTTVTSGNTLTVQTGATTGTAINVDTQSTTGNAVNITTTTTTGNAVNISTGNGITSGAGDISGSALNINTGSSTFSNGADLSLTGGAINVTSTGAFGGISNEASLVRIQSTGNFTGALVRLVADSTQTGTILGISGTSLTTGRAIDVNLGSLYSGQTDVQGAIGAVNIRSGAFTGNILSVSAKAAGAGATSNLVQFQSPQIDGRLLNINVTGAYSGAGAVNIASTAAVTGTLQAITANSATSGTLLSLSGTGLTTGSGLQVAIGTATNGGGADPAVQKAGKVVLGTTGTGLYVNTAAGYTGNFFDLRKDGTQMFAVNQAGDLTTQGGITLNGSFQQIGAGTLSTGTGAVSLNGLTTVAPTGLATETALTVNTGNGVTTGTAVGVNTGTSAFSTTTGAGLGVTSTGAFTGTLGKLTADSTATGTVLGIRANALTSGRALDVDLGASALTGNTTGAVAVRGTGVITGTVTGLTANSATTGTILGINGTGLSTGKALSVDLGASTLASNTGAVEIKSTGVIASGATLASITANSATSGTLLTVSGTAIGASTGTALSVAIGTPTGTDPAVAKAIQLGLGTAGTAIYANAATGYTGNFIDLRVNGTAALTVSQTGAITTAGNFQQTGATTFTTGSGAVSLQGATTVTGTNTFAVSGGLATFGGGLTVSTGQTTTLNGPLTLGAATLQGGVLVSNASGSVAAVAPGSSGNLLTSNGTTWVSQAPSVQVIDQQAATSTIDISFTTEVTIYSTTIPAGYLGTDNQIRTRMYGTWTNSSGGNRTYVIRVKYGATTLIGEITPNVASNATPRAAMLEVWLSANGTTSAQTASLVFQLSANQAASVAGTGDFASAGPVLGPLVVGSGAVDSTVAQTLEITVQSNSNNDTQDFARMYVMTELYR
ncbi:MAG TPA: hypothetical protein VFM93_07850 [Candidatus Limnocylindria bacterium]|nr:hypothetical protein [Candidatus Limnocylindria bacterium]